MKLSSLIVIYCVFLCAFAKADVSHQLFRKVVVFPIAHANFSSSEDAWWQMREALTGEQRFLVASRRFMINRGVYQPRAKLKPADAIILAKILDAEALMTTYLDDRTLKLSVVRGEDGSPLWDASLELHPALPVADQLIRASQKLVQDFLVAIPYQGFQVVEETMSNPVFEVDGQKTARVFHGLQSGLEVGDPVQWVSVRGKAGEPFFNSSPTIEVLAEGKVTSIKGNTADVAIEKARSWDDLKENSLVRFPQEMAKLKAQYGPAEKGAALTAEYLSSEMKPTDELDQGHNRATTTLAVIGNFALMIFLAF